MRNSAEAVDAVLRAHRGLLVRRDHPDLDATVAWWVRRGRLRRLLPGIYCVPELYDDPATRVRAALSWCPDGVLTGAAAAAVSFWPEVRMPVVTIANRVTRRSPAAARAGIVLQERTVPVDLVCERAGLRYTDPALTALDLCDTVGGDGIDAALRTRATTLRALRRVLRETPYRAGNAQRRQLLLDSRDEPWSRLERQAHRLLRQAGITGWRANLPVDTPGGRYWLDVAFPGLRVAVELDGWTVHSTPTAFQSDRLRQNWLVAAGWTVLRFTWEMVRDRPDLVIAQIRDTLESVGQTAVGLRRPA